MDTNLQELRGRVASLESTVDMLESELVFLNDMLMRCGFPEGIRTLKDTVEEVLREESFTQIQERPEYM